MPRDTRALNRRGLIAGGICPSATALTGAARADPAADDFSAIEKRVGGRLGLWAGRANGGAAVGWRADERFLMCSTFKTLAVADVLTRVDRGQERLDRRIAFGSSDLLNYGPVTRDHVAEGGMTLGALCAAAIEYSDNTAANLILATFGGPAGLTEYLRGLGDTVTRLDRTEPTLNLPNPPGDDRDTTTPASMTGLWRKVVVGDALSPGSRAQLNSWLLACQTGAARLPAATPKGWTIGHKTGSGDTTIGDVAVLTPPAGAPILIAVYLDGGATDARDGAIADAGRLALGVLAPNAA